MGLVEIRIGDGRKSHVITEASRAFLQANGKTVETLFARDWSKEADASGDAIRAGMHAIKSALRDLLDSGEAGKELHAVIGQVLQDAAMAIRAKSGAKPQTQQGRRNAPARDQTESTPIEKIITRHRFKIRRRTLTVRNKSRLTPKMIRLVLTGEDLADFNSLAPDDHIKLFFEIGGDKPEMRDYTPRAFDPAARTLTLDFRSSPRWGPDAKSTTDVGFEAFGQ